MLSINTFRVDTFRVAWFIVSTNNGAADVSNPRKPITVIADADLSVLAIDHNTPEGRTAINGIMAGLSAGAAPVREYPQRPAGMSKDEWLFHELRKTDAAFARAMAPKAKASGLKAVA